MKKPQIFTNIQAQGVAVPRDVLKNLEQGSMESITERWRQFNEGGDTRQGYKIVAYEDGKLYSLQNPDLEYRAKVGTVESPSGGMFLGTTKDFVVDYYGEMTDKQDALLIYQYSVEDVISGQPDEEGEVKVTTAKLISMEVI